MSAEGETFTMAGGTYSCPPDQQEAAQEVAQAFGFDYQTLLQLLITYALFLGQIESVPVGGELRTPPPYIKATTPSGKKFDVGLIGTRTV